jgi:hypothetical protein
MKYAEGGFYDPKKAPPRPPPPPPPPPRDDREVCIPLPPGWENITITFDGEKLVEFLKGKACPLLNP